jgi:hypothetical protein
VTAPRAVQLVQAAPTPQAFTVDEYDLGAAERRIRPQELDEPMVFVRVAVHEDDVGVLIADPARRRATVPAPDRSPTAVGEELDHPGRLHLVSCHVAHELAAAAGLERSHWRLS